MPDLTTEAGVKIYLESASLDFCPKVKNIERLPEGAVSYVYRVDIEQIEQAEYSSIVVKYAGPFTAREPFLASDPSRMLYEYRAMKYIGQSDILSNDFVRVPGILHYDPALSVLIMEDAGCLPSLKSWFAPGICSDTAVKAGEAIGRFLAKLHNSTRGDNAVLDVFDGNTSGKTLSSEAFFGNLPQAAAKFGYTDDFIAQVAAAGRRDVLSSRAVLTHGDFWTSNILVATAGQEHLSLTLLDFELTKPGYPEYDVGQMAAEMYFLAFFRDYPVGLQLLNAFLRAYRKQVEGDEIAADKAAIRAGAHLLFIAPIAWTNEGSQGQLRQIGSLGFELIRAGWENDREALKKSLFGCLL